MIKRMKSSKYIILVFVLVLALSITGCSKKEEIVAKVGDVSINKDEFYDALVKQHGEEALEALISEKIIEQEIVKSKVEVTEEEIDAEYKKMEDYYGGAETLSKTMESYNMTMEDMRKNLKLNLSMKSLVASSITISDEDIAAFYEENNSLFNQAEQVNASHILVATEELANEVVGKLNAGGSFEDLAKEYSSDGSKDMGGNLGFFGKGDMVEPFEKAAFSLPIGEISKPVKSEFGYHIIKVNEKKEAKTGSLENSKEEVREMILESKIPEAFNTWYEGKRAEYEIINNLKK